MFQFLTKLDYLLRETFLGLRRGGWMNWAACSTIMVLLFLFGMSLQTEWQMEKILNQFSTQLELSVYLAPGARATMIEPVVVQMPEVKAIKIISKEQAWAKLVQELGISDIDDATEELGRNPLVDELKVQAKTSEMVPGLATQLAKVQGVEDVRYVDEAVQRLAQLHQGLSWVTLTITMVLTLTSVAVTTTTIRLVVMARRREIEIMQLVGATTAWIYLPFILQGMTFGVVGATLAWSLMSSIKHFLSNLLMGQPNFIKFLTNGSQLTPTQTLLLPLILLSFGGAVGLLGSLFAVRRLAKG